MFFFTHVFQVSSPHYTKSSGISIYYGVIILPILCGHNLSLNIQKAMGNKITFKE